MLVVFEDGRVERDVDVARLHVPAYMPLGRTFHAAKRAQHLLVCDLSGKMNPALFLTDDTIVAMGSWLSAMYPHGPGAARLVTDTATAPNVGTSWSTARRSTGQIAASRRTPSMKRARRLVRDA